MKIGYARTSTLEQVAGFEAQVRELVEAGAELSPEEVQQFRTDLTELTKDSPKTQVASLRFKKVMTKVGTSVASGVRDIVVDVLSEAAKKAIWGA